MKYLIISTLFLIAMSASCLAYELPPIPKDMKGFHHASDKSLTVEENKAIQASVEVLKKEGNNNLDGKDGQGIIYNVKIKGSDYWVMCQNYSTDKEGKLVPVVGGYIWIILDKDFKFKEKKSGA